jgi:predicted TIM-barrel fold metal-dependent hydrolase
MQPCEVFDCHVHLPSPGLRLTWEWEPFTPDVEAAVRYLRDCGVGRILANSVRGEVARSVAEMIAGNDEIAGIACRYPDFVVPACLINTHFPEEALREVERCHDELGMVWIGELCGYAGGYSYDTPAFAEMLQLATELDMVVHIHDDDYQDVSRLCARFPHTTFVLAHLGESPADVRARIGLAAVHPTLYLDMCGNGFERMGVLELAVETAGPERVLFGSDFTINDPAGVIARIQKSRLDEATRRKVLGDNVRRLLTERGVHIE